MHTITILIETVITTLAMTLFSHLVSRSFRAVFEEPLLLAYLMRLADFNWPEWLKATVGWLLHFGIGLFFVVAYECLWDCCLHFNWSTTLLLGAISGFLGILGWMVLFSLPSKKPRIWFGAYFVQLFIAHLVFAGTAALVHRLLGLFWSQK